MATLPNSTTATSSTATEGDVKSFLTNIRIFIADVLGSDSSARGSILQSLRTLLSGSLPKTAAYTVTEADRGRAVVFSGSGGVTLSVAAAATLGDGFAFAVVNNSSGAITVDPNLSETINGSTTYTVQPTETVIVFCDGAKFMLFGKAPPVLVSTFNARSGAVTLTLTDVTNVLGFTPSPNTHNHNGTYAGMTALADCSFNGTYLVFTRANGQTFNVAVSGAGG